MSAGAPQAPSRRRQDVWLAAVCLTAAVAAGLVVGLAGTRSERPALIAALAIITPAPVIVRALQAKFDPFEPINLFVLGILVLFVARPISELAYNSYQFGDYFDQAGFNGALLIALFGTVALYVGYFTGLGARLASRVPSPSEDWTPSSVGRAIAVLLALGGLLFLAFAVQSGLGLGGAIGFFAGRTANAVNLEQSSAYLYLGPYVTIPATSMLLICWQRDRRARWLVATVLVGLIALAITVPRGDRTYILTLILPLLVLPYLRSRRRPKLVNIVILIALVIPALNVIIKIRNESARHNVSGQIATAFTTPANQLKTFMLGPDTAMFSILALTYEVVPSHLSFKPGRVILSTLAEPVPGLLLRNKPVDGQSVVYDYLFFQQAAVTRGGNAAGFFGSSYFDSGFVGIIVYSALVGIVARALWEWWLRNRLNAAAMAIFAATLPLAVVLQRGSFSDTIARSSVLVVPIIVVFWLIGRRAKTGVRSATSR